MQLFDSIPKTRITTKPSTKKKHYIQRNSSFMRNIYYGRLSDYSIANMSEYEITSTT